MFSRRLIVAIASLAIVLSAALFADMYKWVDEEGQTHYGDKPPAGTKFETLRSLPPVSSEKAAKQRERLEQAEREMETRMDERRSKAVAKKAEEQERASIMEQCLAWRRDVEKFDFGMPIYRDEQGRFRLHWRYDPYQGERLFLDDEEWDTEIAGLRDAISTHCGDPDDPKARRLARSQVSRVARCEAARADLEQLMRREVKVADDTLEAHRRFVKEICED